MYLFKRQIVSEKGKAESRLNKGIFLLIMTLLFSAALLPVSSGMRANAQNAAFRTENLNITLPAGGEYPLPSVSVIDGLRESQTDSMNIAWSSSDQTVARLSEGMIIGRKVGKATLTGKYDGSVLSLVNVTVTPGKIKLNASSVRIRKGRKFTLKAISSGKRVDVVWKSSDPKIAQVNSQGTVKARKPGKVTITACSGTQKAKCIFHVSRKGRTTYKKRFSVRNNGIAYNIEMNVSSLVLPRKKTYRLSAAYSDGSGRKLRAVFRSSDPKVVSVSRNGKIQARKKGTAVITALYRNMTCRCRVRVINKGKTSASVNYKLDKKGKARKLEMNLSRIIAPDGKNYQLLCAWNGKLVSASYSTSDSSIASVSPEGVVTTLKGGQVIITGTWRGMKDTCTVDVKPESDWKAILTERFRVTSAGSYKEESRTVSYRTYPTIVAAGSSSIARWSNIRQAFPGCNVINTAINGTTVEDWLSCYPAKILKFQPDAVVLYVGQNNIANMETQDLSQGRQTGEKVTDLLERLHEALPDKPVFYVSICQVPRKDQAKREITEANRIIKNYCDHTPMLHYIDLVPYFYDSGTQAYAIPLFNDKGSEKIISKKLHPSALGYQVWKEKVGLPVAEYLYS